jgi:hypothetical protein
VARAEGLEQPLAALVLEVVDEIDEEECVKKRRRRQRRHGLTRRRRKRALRRPHRQSGTASLVGVASER